MFCTYFMNFNLFDDLPVFSNIYCCESVFSLNDQLVLIGLFDPIIVFISIIFSNKMINNNRILRGWRCQSMFLKI